LDITSAALQTFQSDCNVTAMETKGAKLRGAGGLNGERWLLGAGEVKEAIRIQRD